MRQHQEHETNAVDARDTEASRFIDDIDSLLSTGRYVWALATLEGLQATVQRTGYVTLGQRQALKNIEAGLWLMRRRF